MAPKVVFLMADYGHDPTETAIPWKVFQDAGFESSFATENGKMAACDEKMLSGLTGALLGANKTAKDTYKSMTTTSDNFQSPMKWTDPSFNLDRYDLVFLPGGHDKGMRQVIDSTRVHELLASYFPKVQKPSNKTVAAICHGVQVLAAASTPDGKSVLHEVKTTALPAFMEQGIFHTTKMFLGDYYKTYGAGTDSVQDIVTKRLGDKSQFVNSMNPSTPFVVEDDKFNYLSARFPPDAELLAKRAVERVKEVTKDT